jgi:lauroyl/myristoyl acyltransferase
MEEHAGDIDVRVAAVQMPVSRCAMPSAPLRVRLGTTQPLRSVIPTRMAVARARRRGMRLWDRLPEERERARDAMATIVAGTPRAHEVETLARAHVIEGRVKEALFWQPWRTAPLAADDAENLRTALTSGRGVLLSTCHTGPYLHGLSALAGTGLVVHSASAWALDEPIPGHWGRRIAVRRNRAAERNERLVRSAGSYAVLAALLQRGEVVSVYFSMPGSLETHFLGKPVMLASGSARLATSCDALVLPLRARVNGHRVHVDVAAALDPRSYEGVETLHQALAMRHEHWLLQAPEAMEDPNRGGAWEGAARRERWSLPEARACGARVAAGHQQRPAPQPV